MNKEQLIKEIYRNCPDHSTGINGAGEHIIEFSQESMLIRATLERLSFEKLQMLAITLKLKFPLAMVSEAV